MHTEQFVCAFEQVMYCGLVSINFVHIHATKFLFPKASISVQYMLYYLITLVLIPFLLH